MPAPPRTALFGKMESVAGGDLPRHRRLVERRGLICPFSGQWRPGVLLSLFAPLYDILCVCKYDYMIYMYEEIL
jgi:hypothetical protein